MDEKGRKRSTSEQAGEEPSRRPFVRTPRPRAHLAPRRPGAAIRLAELSSDELMIVGVIAEDARNKVLHAYDQRRRRHVALKQLLGPATPLAEARFRRGALLPARLRHRGIIEIYGFGRWPAGDPFFAMELIHGIELKRLIDQSHTLRERLLLLRHVAACAEAIACAHTHGIIHRDIKPENILISDRGRAVLIDWEIAKDLETQGVPAPEPDTEAMDCWSVETSVGQVMGTPAYMAPEQARGDAVDARADVYALGALLLHVLTGVPPYGGDRTDEVVDQVLRGPPPALSLLPPSLRPELVAVIERALARDPQRRFADGPTLVQALRELRL